LSAAGEQQVLVTVRSEGGTQKDFDILPSATEEAYLRTYPEERKGHAYLEFCREGDMDAILHMIKDQEEDDAEEEGDQLDVLRYKGTFEGIDGTGLHVALRYNHVEIAWLSLALGSNLPWDKFPAPVLQAMEQLGLSKDSRQDGTDVRTLEDSQERTPLALAKELGGPWDEWVRGGRLEA